MFGYEIKETEHILRAKAAPVIEALSKSQGVKAVICFGSYAMRNNDEHSDIDLYAFCDTVIPLAAVRKEALGIIEGVSQLEIDHTETGWDDQWCPVGDSLKLDGLLVEIGYNTLGWLETVARKVKEGALSIPELRFRPYTMLGLLDTAVVLYDPERIIQRIRLKLYPFPFALKRALLAQSIPVAKGSLGDLRDYAKRGIGNRAFHFHLERVLDAMDSILFALNERYSPATKRVEDLYTELKTVPVDFMSRYTMLLETPLTAQGRKDIVSTLESLLEELENMTEKDRKAGQGAAPDADKPRR